MLKIWFSLFRIKFETIVLRCLDCFNFEKKDTEILNGFPMTKINDLIRPGVAPEGERIS